MMKKIRQRIVTGSLAACMVLSSAATGVFAQGASMQTGAAEMDGMLNGQPNYVYRAMGAAATDPLFAQQWALYNDGSFRMEEKENAYPVFDNPFEEPWDSGQWQVEEGISIVRRDEAAAQGMTPETEAAKAVSSTDDVDINIQEAWDLYNTNGKETVIAIIDTGVDYSNEQLADAIWVNEDEIAGDGIDNDGNGFIDDVYGWNFYDNNNKVFTGEEDNHGTHGAGTIAAKRDTKGIAGIAGSSNVKIMIVKALGGKDGSGTTESILKAIKYAEANGASICNLSLGTEGNDALLRQAIADSKMLFVAAAGNGLDWAGTGVNTDRKPTYPAAWNMDNLISVANIQSDGTLHHGSNYGANTIDIAAPGSYILSTVTGGEYSYMTGTSMAAPMVSGVAAMLYSQYGDLTAQEARNIIVSSAKPLPGLTGKVKSSGMLDAGAAFTYDRSLAGKPAEAEVEKPVESGTDTGTQIRENVPTANENTQDKGTAPVIRITSSTLGLKGYLMVNVTDEDGDLKSVRYADGKRTAAWFSSGEKGVPFSLNRDGTGTFSYTNSGVYTFYAADRNGNETVASVTLSASSRSVFDFSDIFRRVFL